MPLDCSLGQDCYIQHYVDRDPTPGVLDFMCGTVANNGHNGIDFALPSIAAMEAGVNVISAAPGRVAGIRDGMIDRIYQPEHAEEIGERTCGNGVLIDHGGGWQTQYCHLRQNTITVREGQRVAKGTVLGQVGLSGLTQFPHIEFVTRHDGEIVDPFDPTDTVACEIPPSRSLWQTPMPYEPTGVIAAGFADEVPDYEDVRTGTAGQETLPGTSPALVVWGLFHNVRPADVVVVTITAPDGTLIFQQDNTIDRAQALAFRAMGRRVPPDGWVAGPYEGTVRILRNGEEIGRRQSRVALEAP